MATHYHDITKLWIEFSCFHNFLRSTERPTRWDGHFFRCMVTQLSSFSLNCHSINTFYWLSHFLYHNLLSRYINKVHSRRKCLMSLSWISFSDINKQISVFLQELKICNLLFGKLKYPIELLNPSAVIRLEFKCSVV